MTSSFKSPVMLLLASSLERFAMAMHLPSTYAIQKQAAHLDVVYSTDAAGFVGLRNSMRSLVWHLKNAEQCTIHVIVPKEDMVKASELVQCFHKSLPGLAKLSKIPAVELHETKPLSFNMSDTSQGVDNAHWFRPAAFTRIFIPDYLPHASRALWLDTDTIVERDVTVLGSLPMNHSLAAALELPASEGLLEAALTPAYKKYAAKISKNASNWFNSGVLLIDVQKYKWEMRSQRVAKWFSILKGVQGDELMLNFEYEDDFDVLDYRWNFGCLTAPGLVNKSQIHYTFILHWSCSSEKPWVDHKDPKRGVNDFYWDAYSPKEKCGE